MHATISVATRTRSYTAVGDPDGSPGRPLVLVFHGSRQDGPTHRRFTGGVLDTLASEGGAVIAYLDGYRGNWNDSRAESSFPARTAQIDDVSFARAVVDEVEQTHRIDRARVIGVGYSNGGQMVFRLLHETPELLAGAVVIAATMPDRAGFLSGHSHTAELPVPVTLVHGTADRIAPFEGGRMAWWARTLFRVGGTTLSSPATAEYFARRNGITAAPTVASLPRRDTRDRGTRGERTAYHEEGRAPVTLYTVIGGGHTVPSPKPAPAIVGRTATDISIRDIVSEMIPPA